MADALGSDTSLLGSTTSGYTYGGSASKKKRKGLIIALVVITILIAGIIAVIYFAGDAGSSTSAPTPTPPPTGSYLLHGSHIKVSQIEAISTFRSSVGGDYPGWNEDYNTNATCGSFQHYLRPFSDLNASDIGVYSPLDGVIPPYGITNSNDNDLSWGSDIEIVGYTDAYHQFKVTFRYVVTTLTVGSQILKGQKIGYHAGNFVPGSPISVLNYTGSGFYVSMFNVMDETELKEFQEVNITNRTYPIITYRQRKQYPLNCTGEGKAYQPIANDTNNGYPYPNWVYTNNTSPAKKELSKSKIKSKKL